MHRQLSDDLLCHPFCFFGNSDHQKETLQTTLHIYYQCFLSAVHLVRCYLSSITGRTWETGALSQVWLLFSFHRQTRVVRGTISPSSCSFSSFHLLYDIYISVGFTAVNQQRGPFIYPLLLYDCVEHERDCQSWTVSGRISYGFVCQPIRLLWTPPCSVCVCVCAVEVSLLTPRWCLVSGVSAVDI